MMTLFEKALVLHLIGDWLLQNDWMARNKMNLRHPAAWVHMAIHGVLQGIVFGPLGGAVQAVVHILIDTRIPQRSWSRFFRQTQTGEMSTHVAVWSDQVMHLMTIAGWILVAPHLA